MKKMKLEEDLKAVRYIRECIDLVVDENGNVTLPAWQFALFVREYENYRHSSFAWLALLLLAVVLFIIFPMLG